MTLKFMKIAVLSTLSILGLSACASINESSTDFETTTPQETYALNQIYTTNEANISFDYSETISLLETDGWQVSETDGTLYASKNSCIIRTSFIEALTPEIPNTFANQQESMASISAIKANIISQKVVEVQMLPESSFAWFSLQYSSGNQSGYYAGRAFHKASPENEIQAIHAKYDMGCSLPEEVPNQEFSDTILQSLKLSSNENY